MSENGYACLKCKVWNDFVSPDGYCEPCEIDRLRAEVERLKEVNTATAAHSRCKDEAAKLLAEIDRLRADNKELEGALQGSRDALQACVDDCNALRAENVRLREQNLGVPGLMKKYDAMVAENAALREIIRKDVSCSCEIIRLNGLDMKCSRCRVLHES